MAKGISIIRLEAQQVQNATQVGENTAQRVGGVLVDIVDKAEEHETDIDNLNSNTGVDDYPTFSESTAYSAGEVVNYQGKLYQFTADHAAGTWTGTDAAETDAVKAHIVQEFGDDENSVISQKATTKKLTELESETNSQVYVINNGGKEDLVTLANSVIVKLWIDEDSLPDDISEDKTLYLRQITKNYPEIGNQIWLSYKKNDGTVASGDKLQLEQGVQYGFVKGVYSEAVLDFTKLSNDNTQPLFSNGELYLINPIAFDTAILSSDLRKRQNIISSFIIDEFSLCSSFTLKDASTGLLSRPYSSAIRSILIPVISGYTYELQDIGFATGYENIAVFYSELPNRENSTSVKISTATMQSFSVIAPENAAFMVINIYPQFTTGKNPRVIQKANIANGSITSSKIIDNGVSADKAYILDSRNMYQYFVQPKSNTDNLIVRTNIYLRSINNINQGDKLRFYDQEKDSSWCSSQLIEVKPNTLYTIEKVNRVAEFDENFVFIKRTSLSSSYEKAEFTTGETTKYLNFNIHVRINEGDIKFDTDNTVSMQEGSHEELLPKQTENGFCGI